MDFSGISARFQQAIQDKNALGKGHVVNNFKNQTANVFKGVPKEPAKVASEPNFRQIDQQTTKQAEMERRISEQIAAELNGQRPKSSFSTLG